MVLATYQLAREFPNEGPDSVEGNPKNAQQICEQLVRDFRKSLSPLKEDNPDFIEFKEEIKNVSRVLSTQKHKSKTVEELRGNFAEMNIDEDELFLIKELGEALIHTVEYLAFVDPKKERSGINDPMYFNAKAEKGARANISFGDFFIKMHKRFNMDDDEMGEILNGIFSDYELDNAFIGRSDEKFPIGVYALVGAYLALDKVIDDKGEFKMPTVEQDVNESFDLIWLSADQSNAVNRYFEVKAAPKNFGMRIYDTADSEQIESMLNDLRNYAIDDYTSKIYASVYDIQEAIINHKKNGENCSGYIVFVPVE